MTLGSRVLGVGFGVLALLAWGGLRGSDAAVLCRKRSGRVVISDACSRKATPLAARDVGLVGPTGATGDTGAAGEPEVLPYRVTDAMGRQVGIVQSYLGDRVQVVLTHAALLVPIQVEVIDGHIAASLVGDTVRYEAGDCTGAPLIREGGSPLPRAELVGDTLYYATAEPTSHDFASIETEDTTCSGGTPTARGTCCRAQALTTLGAPATAILLATLGITEPLAVAPRP
jgi:hypothetical protein